MNKMKKFASIAAAVLMTACMAAPMTSIYSFAEGETGNTDTEQTGEGTGTEAGGTDGGSGTQNPDAGSGDVSGGSGESGSGESGSGTTPTVETIVKDEETANKITINGSIGTGHSYKAYKIFGGTVTGSGDSKTITAATWGSDAIKSAVTGASISGITWPEDKDATASMNAIVSYANSDDNKKALAKALGNALASVDATATSTAGSNEIDITSAGSGWYLIIDDTSSTLTNDSNKQAAYSAYILGTVDATKGAIINAKSSAPTVQKKVKEDDSANTSGLSAADYETGTQYNDIADYSIGEAVPFKLYGTLPQDYADYKTYYYKFTDNLGTQFDKPTALTIKAGNVTLTATCENNAWTVKDSSSAEVTGVTVAYTTGSSFTVTFDNLKEAFPTAGKDTVITVEYTAKLNSNAVVGKPGQDNAVNLEYSNNPNSDGKGTTGTTPDDKVRVYTYALEIDKKFFNTDNDDLTQEEIKNETYKDVTFQLKSGTGDSATTLSFVKLTDDTNYDYILADSTTSGATTDLKLTKITTGSGSEAKDELVIRIKGLDEGTYTLVEKEAPDGFNKAPNQTIKIDADTNNTQDWGMADDTLTQFDYTVGELKVHQASEFTVNSTEYTDVTYDTTTGKVTGFKNGETAYTVDYNSDTVKIKQGETEVESADAIISEIAKLTTIDATAKAKIENRKGASLPSTGGIGTTLFYVGGGALVAVAGVFLITKKRMSQKED